MISDAEKMVAPRQWKLPNEAPSTAGIFKNLFCSTLLMSPIDMTSVDARCCKELVPPVTSIKIESATV